MDNQSRIEKLKVTSKNTKPVVTKTKIYSGGKRLYPMPPICIITLTEHDIKGGTAIHLEPCYLLTLSGK